MSRTLTLIEAGWDSIRALAEGGLHAKALEQLTRLLARPDLPAELLAEGHRLAGELAFDLERHTVARWHLKTAATLDPQHAGTRYLLGRTWEEDPDGCDRRAAICYKKAAALEATNPLYRAAFGRGAVRCGMVKRGTREMLAAAEQAAGDLAVIRVVVAGLLEVGKVNQTRKVIAAARFLHPNNAELAAMGQRVQFEAARLTQRKRVKTAKIHVEPRYAQDAPFATDGDRVTLPFVRMADGGVVRRDAASFPRPHFPRLRARKADC